MEQLPPCPHRTVDREGRIVCDQVKEGEREVTLQACRMCPVSKVNCAHLRATLLHWSRPPITIRYGNGKTEIWDAEPPTLSVRRSACAALAIPLASTHDCAGCALHQAPCFVSMPPTRAQAQPARKSHRVSPIARDLRRPATANKIVHLDRWLSREQSAQREAASMVERHVGKFVPSSPAEKQIGSMD